MATVKKVLGQSSPGAASMTTLYTCPTGSGETVLSCVVVCNRSTTPTSFRLSVDVNGAGDSNEDYIAYDVPIEGNESIALAQGVTMSSDDLLRCYATLATLTFSAFGQETS